MNDIVQIPTLSTNPNDYQIIEELQGLKVYKANQRTIVSIPNGLRGGGTAEIYCGASARLDVVSLFVEGHGHKIIIGDQSVVRSATIGMAGDTCTLQIGKSFKCGPVRFILHKGSINIGDRVLFSQDIVVRTSDMHSIIDIETGSVINPPKDVVFGDRVWIGQGCIINKGARIGSDTVIGARSLVTGEIPSNVVAYGAPAEVRRRGIRWSVDAP